MTRTPLRHLVATLLVATALTACSGEDASEDGATPEEVLTEAKQHLDDTSGVHLVLSTDQLPSGTSGVLRAEGDLTRDPAFEGTLTVLFSGLTADVPVIAVDGKVFAKIPPLQTRWNEVDPADYDAPDPSGLISPEDGIPAWLTEATDVATGAKKREGRAVVTTYTGVVPGDAVKSAIPTADAQGSFQAEFRIDDEGRFVGGTFEGPFYASGSEVTYDLVVTEYGLSKEITAP